MLIVFTLEVLKLFKSKDISFEQSENIFFIVVTFEVSKYDKSSEVKFEHPLNKFSIFSTFEVFIFVKFISVKDIQFKNKFFKLLIFGILKLYKFKCDKLIHPLNKFSIFSNEYPFRFSKFRFVNCSQPENIEFIFVTFEKSKLIFFKSNFFKALQFLNISPISITEEVSKFSSKIIVSKLSQ